MEIMNAILNAISTVGFPIVIAFGALWVIYKLELKHADEVRELTENYAKALKLLTDSHNAGNKELITAINNNTQVINILCERIEHLE